MEQNEQQYIVSARKYRPENFGTLIGQDNIARTLKNSILRGQLAHAYLFCGPRGVGKTTTARIFAKMINCSNPSADMEPCGVCESCRSFAEGRSYCIHELDAASNNGVEDIKNLMDQVRVPPQVGKYSVYIIDEVHMLSSQAFNAFLKTLEEPPAHAIFILATTEKHKILPTILSRCQTYDFNRISVDDIVKNLRMVAEKEGITIDDESLHVIAHKADGAMRDALTIFDQTVAFCGTDVKYADVIRNLNVLDYEYSFSLVEHFLSGDYAFCLKTFDEILAKGFNALHFVGALSSHLRDLIVSKSGGIESLLELPASLKARYSEQAAKCSLAFLYEALGITTGCEANYKAATNPRLHIEFALMRLCFILNRPSAGAPVQTAVSPQPTPVVAAQPVAAQPVASSQPTPVVAAQPAASPQPARTAPVEEKPSVVHETPAIKTPESAAPAADAASAEQAAPQPRARRAGRTGGGMSMKALVENAEKAENTKVEIVQAELPSDDALKARWPELAALYRAKPRLYTMLTNSKLEFETVEGKKVVRFQVVNDAQKEWVESKLLHELEGHFRRIAGSDALMLSVTVAPVAEGEKVVYMPSDKAKVLMENNEEVKNLVKDFSLDIK
ncbi:MAG: DNA polymerase III subunit gamma/tau [Candidatus Cryptobacteroides sp.]|nr:DNA polymerase III subunit gamma/tau [Bacteroidales bacterium]MDY2773299.1 DNA polymerase III subunit gamma/tau [Candidatus Cryptobacteroides sp.]